MRNSNARLEAGTRPAEPVRLDSPPDDYLCSWSVKETSAADGSRSQVWQLNFINAACFRHARLAAQ